ncbi:hypothetical protein JL720_590 [Aureococcus anophagefferens]|nr:hypothetical protein JL720_590 [Aureococcus anophagefferens]
MIPMLRVEPLWHCRTKKLKKSSFAAEAAAAAWGGAASPAVARSGCEGLTLASDDNDACGHENLTGFTLMYSQLARGGAALEAAVLARPRPAVVHLVRNDSLARHLVGGAYAARPGAEPTPARLHAGAVCEHVANWPDVAGAPRHAVRVDAPLRRRLRLRAAANRARRRRAGGAAGRGGRARAGRDARRPALRGRAPANGRALAIGEALRLARTIRRFHASARDLGVCLDYHVVAADDQARGAAEAELRRRAEPLGVELRRRVRPRAGARARDARARVQVAGRVRRARARGAAAAAHGAAGVAVERTLYLDSDALACARLDGFFAALGESDVAYVSTTTIGKYVRRKTGLDAIFDASAAPPGAAPVAESAYLNAGVLAFRNSTGARRLLAAWRRVFVDEYLRGACPRALDAGPAGAVVGARTTPGVALERLPDEYHCKTHTTGATRRRLSDFGKADKKCTTLLKKKKLDWLLEPFTCTKSVKTSNVALVLGTGLGDTGTRSVAKAVDALGVPTCHRTTATLEALGASNRRDMTPFASSGAWFDTPLASVWRRVACSFPNYKVVHTTRAGDRPRYHRDYSHGKSKCRADTKEHYLISRCLEYGTTCPTLADALVAFDGVAASLDRHAPRDKVHVMNMSTGFRLFPLAAFLGKPVPRGMRGVPRSKESFCRTRAVAEKKKKPRVVTRHRSGKKKKKPHV